MLFRLERVHYMPKVLEPGVLYYTQEFSTCAHLCACGCGVKVRTPISPVEWSVEEGSKGPSLWPSVGNWQQECRSHYWIRNGSVKWAEEWTEEEIQFGRTMENIRRQNFYKTDHSINLWNRFRDWIKSFL